MKIMRKSLAVAVALALSGGATAAGTDLSASPTVRFATFNASLNRDAVGQLLSDLSNPGGADFTTTVGRRIQQARNVAEIIQRVRPDVLLINEFDFDLNGAPTASGVPMPRGYSSSAAGLFQSNFLSVPQGNAVRGSTSPIEFAHRYTPNTNTGLHSGFDLNNFTPPASGLPAGTPVSTPGVAGYGDDAFGFGNFPGQFGMTIYSKYEIVRVRSFQNFLWKDMPNNLLTNDPSGGGNNLASFYSPAEIAALRLSSKNHVDVTLKINGVEVHFLTAHPTPPVFDGSEDRNGKRNHDEIRFWKDYVNGAGYIYDDAGTFGGLAAGARFVIAGDYNADLCDGDSYKVTCLAPNTPGIGPNAIGQLLTDPLINVSVTPQSAGGTQAATDPNNNGGNLGNLAHVQDPKFDTADFNDANPGNLRVDYVLPSGNLAILDAGVFWPVDGNQADGNTSGDLFDLVGQFNKPGLYAGLPSSDHKAVWVDIAAPVPEPETYAMMLCGLGIVGWGLRRRARRAD
ncbi:endonuclease/exonuclease/phosphatase family protein [Luteitalea sp.]|uniref:endonuclease/exonuclease/phosphatase family protein n=1 Tax=Luteitalea sp. TaxID=2004800 RepID=UPI0025BEEF77|nr:endonuclease/exonuclease/phosphatase family protein [Luteitalea sp.]